MSAKNLKNRMAEEHEAHVAEVLGARRARGSGNQWRDPADGRMDRREHAVAFAFDCKSTRTATISLTRDGLDKLTEQAHGDRPLMPLRFYGDDRLRTFEDWVALKLDDLVELLDGQGEMDFTAWKQYAIDRGWIAEGFCQTHDATPMTEAEEEFFEEGGDPCIPTLRVWDKGLDS